jgi:hypothetical protein
MHVLADAMLMLSAVILLIAALWHLYWVLGGTAGMMRSIPQRDTGEPSRPATLLVAVLISALSGFYAFEGVRGLTSQPGQPLHAPWDALVLGLIGLGFVLRAVGDFNYIGFFKRRRSTAFAHSDNLYYSPLCLVLGTAGLWAALTRIP